MMELLDMISALEGSAAEPAVLATLFGVCGSSYRKPGAHMIIQQSGNLIGSLGGGCLDKEIYRLSRAILTNGEPRLIKLNTSAEEDDHGYGIGCGGVLDIFFETAPAEVLIEYLRRLVAYRGHSVKFLAT